MLLCLLAYMLIKSKCMKMDLLQVSPNQVVNGLILLPFNGIKFKLLNSGIKFKLLFYITSSESHIY